MTTIANPVFYRWALSCVPCIALLCAATAAASGYLSVMERREKKPSHAACVALLETTAAGHRKQVKPRTFKADGIFQQISLEDRSGGVEILGPKKARYEARIWYNNGWFRDDIKAYEISHSWNGTDYECRGRILVINTSSGYTLSSFEPVPIKQPE